jgi:uncharacterized protein YecE (DUF72 family)
MASRRGRARVGCSGWNYRNWRGLFYPEDVPVRSWFEHYAEVFDTVELNTTFYRLPDPATVTGWAEQAPRGFTFAAKLGQFGSHRKKLKDAATWLPNHLDRIQRLGDHAGPTLVQLPPRWHRDVDRLEEFLTVAGKDRRWAVELRDPTWLHDDVYDCLRRHEAALCLHDLLPDHPWMLTTDWTYVRFHGPHAVEAPYQGRYGGRRLWRVADRLEEVLDGGGDVYGYFNNDWDANATADAAWLRDRLGRET